MTKKILLIIGTRPNFIKITQFHEKIKKYANKLELCIVHTGQHYDYNMSKVFFEQLKIRRPDYFLNIKANTPSTQIGNIIIKLETIIQDYDPDVVMVVGDVNSTLAAAITANKCNKKIAHLESGLRSNDLNMPEEINRLLTDRITDYFFVTEQSGVDNLKKEGISAEKIFFVGNTMIDTLVHFEKDIEKSNIIEKLKIHKNQYALMTMHRPRNVDTEEKINILFNIISRITQDYDLVFPIHPRTKNSFIKYNIYNKLKNNSRLIFTDALDYFAFQKLIKYCSFVVTDSGGIQEETTFRKTPCLTLRENTERPSTLILGTNKLVKYNVKSISEEINLIKDKKFKDGDIPPYWDGKATERIFEILLKQLT